jgi:hypothetical protein
MVDQMEYEVWGMEDVVDGSIHEALITVNIHELPPSIR